MKLNVLALPGDGIGVEVTREAVRVLQHVARKHGHALSLTEGLLGGIAIHQTGNPLPEETLRLALEADATLMGSVGLPEFDQMPPSQRPEAGLLGLRKALGATPRVIRRQFLVEASTLGLVGGLAGATLGVVGAEVLPHFISNKIAISGPATLGAIAVAMVIGVVFGVYPASRAARLAPIEALRSD